MSVSLTKQFTKYLSILKMQKIVMRMSAAMRRLKGVKLKKGVGKLFFKKMSLLY